MSLQSRTIRVTQPDAGYACIEELRQKHNWQVIFGRYKHGDGHLTLAHPQTCLEVGDLITMIGAKEELDRVMAYLGEPSQQRLELDRSEYDFRRIFVSNPKVAGHRLRDFDLLQQYGAIVTRIRRGVWNAASWRYRTGIRRSGPGCSQNGQYECPYQVLWRLLSRFK
jgi:putative transport protein